jgi:hypothetical protein
MTKELWRSRQPKAGGICALPARSLVVVDAHDPHDSTLVEQSTPSGVRPPPTYTVVLKLLLVGYGRLAMIDRTRILLTFPAGTKMLLPGVTRTTLVVQQLEARP